MIVVTVWTALALLASLAVTGLIIALQKQRNLEAERIKATKAIATIENTLGDGFGGSDEKDPQYWYSMYVSSFTAASALEALGDSTKQVSGIEQAIKAAENASNIEKANVRYSFAVCYAYRFLWRARARRMEYAKAIEAMRKGIAAADRMIYVNADMNDRIEAFRYQGHGYRELAEMADEVGNLEDAVEFRTEAEQCLARAFSIDTSSIHSEDDLSQAGYDLERAKAKLKK